MSSGNKVQATSCIKLSSKHGLSLSLIFGLDEFATLHVTQVLQQVSGPPPTSTVQQDLGLGHTCDKQQQ